jgi:multidrug efflux pump subunit AcrB
VRSREGRLVPVSELVEVRDAARERRSTTRTCCRWSTWSATWAASSIRRSTACSTSAARSRHGPAEGGTLGEWFIRQPPTLRRLRVKWDGEWQITYETFRDMGAAYAVGLILIYLLVVAQFGSYLVPLIIMAPIPLTIIGVMPGHALLGAQFTATSMIGMIALAGIIVRNSILLVDFINQQVAAGMPFHEAVIQSAAVRAKPIALTALAAMLGACSSSTTRSSTAWPA